MTIDQHILELINADIDGEITPADRERLRAELQSNPEAQKHHDEMTKLVRSLDALPSKTPPPHMRHNIMDTVNAIPHQRRDEVPFWKSFLVAPPLHYVGTFAAGSLVTFLIVSSNEISQGAFDEVTDLVGTMSSDTDAGGRGAAAAINLTDQTLAGTVRAHRAGPIMVIDFDLTSAEPVEIIAAFADPDVWFNGFAQLESDGTRVAAETGRVSLQMSGKRRYAMYLHNASRSAATVKLQFFAGDRLILEDDLTFRSTN